MAASGTPAQNKMRHQFSSAKTPPTSGLSARARPGRTALAIEPSGPIAAASTAAAPAPCAAWPATSAAVESAVAQTTAPAAQTTTPAAVSARLRSVTHAGSSAASADR